MVKLAELCCAHRVERCKEEQEKAKIKTNAYYTKGERERMM